MDDIYLLVIGLGVCTGVIALLGVDGFCSSNLLDILNSKKLTRREPMTDRHDSLGKCG